MVRPLKLLSTVGIVDNRASPVTGVTQLRINDDTSVGEGLTPVSRLSTVTSPKRRLAGAPTLQRRSATVTVTTATPIPGTRGVPADRDRPRRRAIPRAVARAAPLGVVPTNNVLAADHRSATGKTKAKSHVLEFRR
jgi:hypothetical protein